MFIEQKTTEVERFPSEAWFLLVEVHQLYRFIYARSVDWITSQCSVQSNVA